jgi:hypothetical protein
MKDLYDLYSVLVGSNHVPVVNAALLGIVFLLARQRYKGIIEDFTCLQKFKRECELTFAKNGITMVRED